MDRFVVGDIEDNPAPLVTEAVADCLRACLAGCRPDDDSARPRERLGDGSAYASRCAGDQGDLALECVAGEC